jgi:uncharacterized protein GlcG (DUF336 family)
MSRISLTQAKVVLAKAFEKGVELGLKPLSVAVLDAGGHLIAFERQDGSSNLRAEIARGKAAGALALGVSSRQIGVMAAERPTFVTALGQLSGAGLIPVAGGVIIVDDSGAAIGAVGVTGDTSDNDEICALAGIAAANLSARA